MIGVILLLVATLWLLFDFFISWFIAKKIVGFYFKNKTISKTKNYFYRFFIFVITVTIIYPLPVLDDIVAKFQFEHICKEHSKVWIDKDARGKTVYLLDTEDVDVKGTWVNVTKQLWKYVDVNTKKVIVEYAAFIAGPGIFSRRFMGPFFFKRSCYPENTPIIPKEFLDHYGIYYIEPPTE